MLLRRLRYGRPIVVVSGLPRSGTSLAMKMLGSGGMPLLTDGIRVPDQSNPMGYYELERVKQLETDGNPAWLRNARGKAVKIISMLLTHLPETHNYRVIFMHRNLDEVLASQETMLAGTTPRELAPSAAHDELRAMYEAHLQRVKRFLSTRNCFYVLDVGYADAISDPEATCSRISRFVGRRLDVQKMAAVVDRQLYRNRSAS